MYQRLKLVDRDAAHVKLLLDLGLVLERTAATHVHTLHPSQQPTLLDYPEGIVEAPAGSRVRCSSAGRQPECRFGFAPRLKLDEVQNAAELLARELQRRVALPRRAEALLCRQKVCLALRGPGAAQRVAGGDLGEFSAAAARRRHSAELRRLPLPVPDASSSSSAAGVRSMPTGLLAGAGGASAPAAGCGCRRQHASATPTPAPAST